MKTNTGNGSAKAGRKPSGAEDNSELKKLYHEILKDTYNAEKQLLKALPKMAKGATSEELTAAFEDHLSVTEEQVTRLEQVFEASGLKVSSKKCEAMEGLVKEGEEAIEETEDGSLVRDVALIVAAQKVEHYEIAAYGSLRSIASILGLSEAANLLQETLDEEGDADKTLSDIASQINAEAYESDDEDSSSTRTPEKSKKAQESNKPSAGKSSR
ncbi:MAG: ferritin-like domain-containing protein [Sphingobacteriales bacterium JAD_PAG50586_3]|nr:MAG: ferritin-like domain-containing protein [Sphingobacteriales bacterium JAD_PAG50586_3]